MSSQASDQASKANDARTMSRWGAGLMLVGVLMMIAGLPAAGFGAYGLSKGVSSVTENIVAKATLGESLTIPQTEGKVRVFVDFGGKLPRPSGSAINNTQRQNDMLAREERGNLQRLIDCESNTLQGRSVARIIGQYVLQGTADPSNGEVTVNCSGRDDAAGLTYLATTGGTDTSRSGLTAVLGILAAGGGLILIAIGSIIRMRGERTATA